MGKARVRTQGAVAASVKQGRTSQSESKDGGDLKQKKSPSDTFAVQDIIRESIDGLEWSHDNTWQEIDNLGGIPAKTQAGTFWTWIREFTKLVSRVPDARREQAAFIKFTADKAASAHPNRVEVWEENGILFDDTTMHLKIPAPPPNLTAGEGPMPPQETWLQYMMADPYYIERLTVPPTSDPEHAKIFQSETYQNMTNWFKKQPAAFRNYT
eukprot:g5602.t1